MTTKISPHLQRLIEAARARHAERISRQCSEATEVSEAPEAPEVSEVSQIPQIPETNTPASAPAPASNVSSALNFNKEQLDAISAAMEGKNFCLIGAAGTGKTTVTQEIISRLQQASHVSPLVAETKYLQKGNPGIAVVGFTNTAVENVKKKLPPHLAQQCLTIHKLLEFAPVEYEEEDEEGNTKTLWRFEPTYHAANKLPHISVIISEESSMTGTDLWGQLIAALPNPGKTQFIMLGDLNQIPPVFGPSILGFKLLEYLTVELVHVYRQALESPIIALATAVRTNQNLCGSVESLTRLPHNLTAPVTVDNPGHGTVTIHPWKKRVDADNAIHMMRTFLPKQIDSGLYNPNEDMILCPFNVNFGVIELNNIIANHLTKLRGEQTWEIRARRETVYYAVGDRVLHDRKPAIIMKIEPSIGYVGKTPRDPSTLMDRWGRLFDENGKLVDGKGTRERTAEEIMQVMESMTIGSEEGERNLASHTIWVRSVDLPEDAPETSWVRLSSAGDINKLMMGYALTVHKSQGSEWKRVFLFLHNSHAKGTLLSRELIYTAITRAKEFLYIICEGDSAKYQNSIRRAADRPVITGTTLREKAEWFKGKAKALGFATEMES